MLATFRETLASLQNKDYGQKIVSLPFKAVLWYWTKYLVLFTLLSLLLSLGFITYVVPQLPRAVRENFPEGEIGFRKNQLYSTAKQPVVWGNSDFAFILNTQGEPADLDKYSSGVLLLSDRYLVKDQAGTATENQYKSIPDFQITHNQVIDWVNTHQVLLWILFFLAAVIFSLLIFAGLFVYRLISFFAWGAVVWLIAKLLKRTLAFMAAVKIIIYASVIPLIISGFQTLAPNQLISFLSFGLFVFFAGFWFWNLPSPVRARPQISAPLPVKTARPKRRRRSV